jgi:ABC-type lipoprotein export system ATPase subunit
VTALVELRDVFRVFPTRDGGVAALQGLSLDVADGEICVVLGPSGSGKTTLLRVLAGFERASAGSVRVAGRELGRLSAGGLGRYRATTTGYADQHYRQALAGELSAAELVGATLGLAGAEPAERARRADELLERVGLLDRRDARPDELSGGEQQRVALCAALAHRPRLLLADEPTGELDAATAASVTALLAELVREAGASALVVSHDPASTAVADRVVGIRDGRVSEEASNGAGPDAVVVGRGGWLRVPEELLAAAGIGGRATVGLRGGVVELRPLVGESSSVGAPRATVSPAGVPGTSAEVRALTRRFGHETALQDVDAAFRPGRLTVVTGPSGSGKSTLLQLLAGLDVPTAGEVEVGGVVLSGLDRSGRAAFRRERIALVSQTPTLTGFLDARENVRTGLAVRGVDGTDANDRADEALAAVGLSEHAGRPVDELSAGQRGRVAVARAVAARPLLLLADEPTARLDATTTVTVGSLLRELAHRSGTTLVCATHDPLLIEQADDELRLG